MHETGIRVKPRACRDDDHLVTQQKAAARPWRRARQSPLLLLVGLGLTAALGTAAARVQSAPVAPVAVPARPAGLPSSVEALAPYVPQDSCDTSDKPGSVALAHLLTATYPDTSIIGISYACGSDGPVSEHYEGRAIDWAINPSKPAQQAEATALLGWLFGPDAAGVTAGNARRLGVMYAMWDARIIGTYNLAAGWRPVTCSGVTACHRDHVHLSLSWAGARGITSWWTHAVAGTDWGPCRSPGLSLASTAAARPVNPAPCPAVAGPAPPPAKVPAALSTLRTWSGATLGLGSRGPVVTALQQALGLTADGAFGPLTLTALQAFQTSHGVPSTGSTDPATWTSLLGLAGVPPAPAAPVEAAAVQPNVVHVTAPVKRPVLRLGSTGISVRLVQSLLHVKITGLYGPTTGNAVRRFQRLHHLQVDGQVGPKTWHALGR